MDLEGRAITITYDGECPFCRSYVAYADLKARYEQVTLVDARTAPEKTAAFLAAGYDLDDSFIVEIDDRIYTGGDALWIIHSFLAPRGKTIARFRNRRFLSAIYPALRAGRNLALRVLGKEKINPPKS